jgi:hypothetical protein
MEVSMGKILMSKKERRRLEAFARVRSGEWTLVQVSTALRLSYRQTKRAWARYQKDGDAGLAHRNRGVQSRRRIADSVREKALAAIRERYADFGPTLMSEYLAKWEEVAVSVSTLRRWLKSADLSTGRRRRSAKHRTRRARKEHFGELVQLDGSRHDWFEGRRDMCCLMVMIDDATSQMVARFHEVESTAASMDVFTTWVARHGLPVEVYPDRHSIYRTDREATAAEALAGKEPQTQFGRALESFGVGLRLAGSPQAKGRVERMNGTLQDRLVKELRLRGISTLPAANELLASEWFDELSQRFSKQPAQQADLHRPAPSAAQLHKVLAMWETRTVSRDAVVRWSNRWFQLERSKDIGKLAGRNVTVVSREEEVLAIMIGDAEIKFHELSGAPRKGATPTGPTGVNRTTKPANDHPWRKPFLDPKE